MDCSAWYCRFHAECALFAFGYARKHGASSVPGRVECDSAYRWIMFLCHGDSDFISGADVE